MTFEVNEFIFKINKFKFVRGAQKKTNFSLFFFDNWLNFTKYF